MTTIQAGAEPRTALPGGRQRPSTGSRSFIARSRPRGTNTSGCRSGARNRDSTWRRTQRQRDPRGVRIPCRRRVLGRPPPRSLCAIRSTRQAQNVTV